MTSTEPTDPKEGSSQVPYQSLYRRFRPQRFSEVLGQEFVSLALKNAVREERVGHAYLFSGPRGTGKTSTARILAKALNCSNLQDGEPCGVCSSCTEIAAGTSLDVHELDAASNNGVEAMRDLVSRAALGSPGRWKVYIVDEVHMLSAAASNALLKTLEEPPGHVIFVLATTDPQKVLPTIRSRTQHYEFRLIGPEVLQQLLEAVTREAGLELPEHAVEAAVRRGKGSARDALSVLDQVAAAGIVEADATYLEQLAVAIADHDAQKALVGLAATISAGRDPLLVAGELADHLRQGFLSVVAPNLVAFQGDDLKSVSELAAHMGLPALVRAIEALGTVQVEMREAPDPRLHVEVCLLRLTRQEVDDSVQSLLERMDRLERALDSGSFGQSSASEPPRSGGSTPAETPAPAESATPVDSSGGPELARRSLGALRKEAQARKAGATSTSDEEPSSTEASTGGGVLTKTPQRGQRSFERPKANETTVEAAPPTPKGGTFPTRDELAQVWGDGLLASLAQRPRARFRVGRFVEVDPSRGVAVFALPNESHRRYCEEVLLEVEVALSTRFGVPIKLRLIIDPDEQVATSSSQSASRSTPVSNVAEPPDDDEEYLGLMDRETREAETKLAGNALSAAERLKIAFPGAEEV